MKLSQRLSIELSQSRNRINELAGLNEPTDEQRSELEKRMADHTALETRYQAAVMAESDTGAGGDGSGADGNEPLEPPAEDRELSRLTQRASVAAIADAASEQRNTTGAEAELQQHFRLPSNQIPLALLQQQGQLETRDVTPAPGDVGTTQATIIPYVFPRSAHAYLGVSTPSVPVGERNYPVLTTPATVHAPAKSTKAADTTGAFSATVLAPKRLQAEFFYAKEDLATFAGMEQSLRQNLGDALADALDDKIVAQFFAASGGLTNPNNPGAEATFAGYRTHLFSGIDGRYAHMASDLRWLVNADIYKHMASKYRSNNADDSALDSVMRSSGGVRVSAHIPAKASNVSGFLVSKAGGRGMNAAAPVWEGVEIVRDQYSKLDKGEVRLVACMLYNVAILRADGFQRLEVHTG